MALFVTIELNPMPPKTGDDSYFEPVMMGLWSSEATKILSI